MALVKAGDCVRIPDGRPGRVREREGAKFLVRVRRRGQTSNELLLFGSRDLRKIEPPSGWMTAEGYIHRLAAARRLGKKRRRDPSQPAE